MIYTIYVCPECGAIYSKGTVPDPWPKDGAPRCNGHDTVTPLNVVEVIPRAVADELAEILEGDPTKYRTNRALREAQTVALAKYREAKKDALCACDRLGKKYCRVHGLDA